MGSMSYISMLTSLMLIGLMVYILRAENKGAMHYIFLTVILEVLIWTLAVVMRGVSADNQQMVIFWEKRYLYRHCAYAYQYAAACKIV